MSRDSVLREFRGEWQDELEPMDRLVSILQKYGRATNLSASLKPQDLWAQIGEALLMARALRESGVLLSSWLDVGSGGGFPGLVVAILLRGNPALSGQLLEPRQRRVDFLQLALLELKISNCIALRASLEEGGELKPQTPPVEAGWVSARAVFDPLEWRRRAALAWPEAHCVLHLSADRAGLDPELPRWQWGAHQIVLCPPPNPRPRVT